MNRKNALSALALVGALTLAGGQAVADTSDAWITTKSKISLLTTDGVSATAVNVDTVNGNVTLHGKVGTEAEKAKAEQTIRTIDGVKGVKNLLQVVPDVEKKMVNAQDSEIKDKVEAVLKADKSLDGIKVASVNQGVVLLSGTTPTLTQKLRALETAYRCDGVRRVSSEIVTSEK